MIFTRDLPLEDSKLILRIHPIGWRQVKQFASVIVESTSFFEKVAQIKGADANTKTQAVITTLVPFVVENMIDLMWENITYWEDNSEGKLSQLDSYDYESLPHWYIPKIVEEWLKLNFDDEMKWRPWMGAIEEALTKATGEPISISDILSNF